MKNSIFFKAVEDLSPRVIYYSTLALALVAKYGYEYGKTGNIELRGPHLFENPVLDIGVKFALGVGFSLANESIMEKIEELNKKQQVDQYPIFPMNFK